MEKMLLLTLAMLSAVSSMATTLRKTSTTVGKDMYAERQTLLDKEIDKCTTIIVGKNAGTQGPMTTHTADCSDCDFRIAKTPARDWKAGSMRPLYLYKNNYPATITTERGTTWHPNNLEGTPEQLAAWGTESQVLGYIPQVSHTYALYEAGYGIMNEHQVAIGESTCAAIFWGAPKSAGGNAMIEVREMSKIALERTTSAKEAVLLMGSLAEQYGFYAADWSGGDASKGEGGETLTVVDKNEAWVFHVLGDDTGASAVWAAQRVPDDHVAAIANQFIIRYIDSASPDFLHSSNLYDVAKRNNLYNPTRDGPQLDFLKTFAPARAHSPYVTRRVWRVFGLVAPSYVAAVKLSPFTDPYASEYPFSVKPDVPLTPQDLMRIQRDHYEGTQFDLTKGLAAGPYGDPNRWDSTAVDNLTRTDVIQGSFDRAISMFRTSYSIVAVARASVPDQLALVWICQYAPSSSSYAPFYVSAAAVPLPYSRGSLFNYDSSVSFWNFLAVGNYAGRFYKYAMSDVAALQKRLEEESVLAVTNVEKIAMSMLANAGGGGTPTVSLTELLTALTHDQAMNIVTSWKDMLPKLITKYHDGYRAITDGTLDAVEMERLFYPAWWLKAVGFFNSGINTGPGVIMFAPNPLTSTLTSGGEGSWTWMFSLILTAMMSSLLSFVVAYYLMIKGKFNGNSGGYRSIPGMSVVGLGSLREACSNNDITNNNNTTNTTNPINYHHHHKNVSSSNKNNNHVQFSSTELTTLGSSTVVSNKSEYLTLDI